MFGNFLAFWEIRAVALLAASACAAFYFFHLINSWVCTAINLMEGHVFSCLAMVELSH